MTATVRPHDLLNALGAVLQTDMGLRQQAEQFLAAASLQPGCAGALLQIAAEQQLDVGVAVG